MTTIAWNERAAAHLLRRAGFGGTQAEIADAVGRGLDRTVDSLLDFPNVSNDALEARLGSAALDLATLNGIARWWLMRMIFTARPLEERLTWFLHDHFATAFYKVQSAEAMLKQNELLRQSAAGRFDQLTLAISKDPAMLIWLDNWRSRKESPNENYARELLELFSLGHGNYTEADVVAAARAFTGWTLDRITLTYRFVDSFHDHGTKTFLGTSGDLDGGDIVRLACGTEAHGRFIAARVFAAFAHDHPSEELVARLARIYLDGGTALLPLVREVLLSPEMYDSATVRSQVRSPVEFAVAAIRQCGVQSDLTRQIVTALNAQGQVPFNPPDVDGWTSGFGWINSGALLSRMNLANTIAAAVDSSAGGTPTSATALVDAMLARLDL
ncbi:MAG: DUF1800 domain-containing protein, partial [Thermoanaerobaculia bacterium]